MHLRFHPTQACDLICWCPIRVLSCLLRPLLFEQQLLLPSMPLLLLLLLQLQLLLRALLWWRRCRPRFLQELLLLGTKRLSALVLPILQMLLLLHRLAVQTSLMVVIVMMVSSRLAISWRPLLVVMRMMQGMLFVHCNIWPALVSLVVALLLLQLLLLLMVVVLMARMTKIIFHMSWHYIGRTAAGLVWELWLLPLVLLVLLFSGILPSSRRWAQVFDAAIAYAKSGCPSSRCRAGERTTVIHVSAVWARSFRSGRGLQIWATETEAKGAADSNITTTVEPRR
mmetsp:Transcript_2257/g.5350  ORF Transcript_2257/g.5350 Transcript_2257/m.5350 type:complete len:283 (-) Transcript_2257:591-1439(-)